MVQHLSPEEEPLARRSHALHFALLSAALLLATAWTVWDETAAKRPWKSYQRRFVAEAGKALEADLGAARREAEQAKDTPEYAAAKAAHEAASKAYQSAEARAERARIEARLAALDLELDGARHRFQQARGSFQEVVYRFEHGHGDRAELTRLEPEIERLSARMRELQAERKSLVETLRAGREALEQAQAGLHRYDEPVRQLERTLPSLEQEKVEIRQVFNSKLGLVDRCQSCHLGAARAGLLSLPQPFPTHPAVYLRREEGSKNARSILGDHPPATYGCVTCHRGQGFATTSVEEAHGEVEFWPTPLLRKERVWTSCQKCHDAQPDVAGIEKGWEGRRLVASYGCYACHKLPGFEQEAAVRIGPNLNVLARKVYPQWVPIWLQDPRAFRPRTRMPDMLLSDAERRAISAYLLQASEPAPAGGSFPAPSPADAAAGRELFETVGCLGCHSVGGRGSSFGPDLTRVGEKVRPEYVAEWLKDPAKLQPGATMPNLRLSETEIKKLSAYLATLRQSPLPPLDFDPTDRELAARGKALIVRYNCFGCHRIPGLQGRPSLVPDLSVVASKLIEEFDFGLKRKPILASVGLEDQRENVEKARFAWIVNKLRSPRGYDEGRYKKPDEALRMPRFGLSDAEAAVIATYLSGLTAEHVPAEFRAPLSERSAALAAGIELVRKYNCTGCHQIGVERVVLRDGTLLEGTTKLREEGTLYFLLWRDAPSGRTGDIVPVPEKQVLVHSPAPGGEIVPLLVERVLAAQGLSLAQAEQDPSVLVAAEEARANAPPVLFGEGRKVRPAWLFSFLNHPVTLRPWLQVRMPTFPLAPQEAQALARYFAAVDRQAFPFEPEVEREGDYLRGREAELKRAERLFSHSDVKCASCHVRGALKPEGGPAGWAPDLSLARERLRPSWIAAWLTNPQRIQPGTRMPTFFPEGETRYQEIFAAPSEAQIHALRDYVLTIGLRRQAGGASAGGMP